MPTSYVSTNGKSRAKSFGEVLLQGQAPDGGLYMPKTIPQLSEDAIASFAGKSYSEIAYEVTGRFLKDEVDSKSLMRITEEAYNFSVPVQHVSGSQHILWLDEGPTLAFKDFAARMMARLMQYYTQKEDGKLVILVATSGDTGGAIAAALHNLKNIEVMILFPAKEVTGRQRRQMTTLGGNVTAVAVDGKFDDCQALAKEAFRDKELNEQVRLSSANSINFGRLLPQAVYYFYGHSRVEGDRKVFSVPSGNFGNLMGGILAKNMGLPVEKFIAATNENDEFPNFLKTGAYKPVRPSRNCISNAMNVGHPSNLARLIHIYGGRMDERGAIHQKPDMEALRRDVAAESVTDEETRQTIVEVYKKHKTILEPHGAVGWAALQKYLQKTGTKTPAISIETADPAKFPEEIIKAIGIKPPVPESLSKLDGKKETVTELPADYKPLKQLITGEYGQ
ncbi:MAG: threonine synthase [Candidatus Altiarchaeota archaeon]